MGRLIIGAAAAAIAMWIAGFIFFATPLSQLSYAEVSNEQAAAVQGTLAANLPKTGTYHVPGIDTPEQTVMYGQGPIATIHYNTAGFPATDWTLLFAGLVMNFLIALLIGGALIGIDRRVPDFGSRARVVLFFSVAAAAYMHLKEPLYFHHGWAHVIYMLIADAAVLIVGGLVIARWFLPRVRSAPDEAPREA